MRVEWCRQVPEDGGATSLILVVVVLCAVDATDDCHQYSVIRECSIGLKTSIRRCAEVPNAKECQRAHFDRRHATRRLPKLSPGSTVWVKDLKRPGEVHRQADTPMSYWVRTISENVRRNRRALNRIPAHSGQHDYRG
ncbi:hypothetical protein HPB47_005391 [Ixodes persulcatus]|uniref:Uncharacterized protein n=1 Tax=Ixodes persulcatus TaxID=34615 RepID=A0AC60PDI8_IXOPE|nr:hypothetical protein HPB47_005391 [Ixodes persulcatus]